MVWCGLLAWQTSYFCCFLRWTADLLVSVACSFFTEVCCTRPQTIILNEKVQKKKPNSSCFPPSGHHFLTYTHTHNTQTHTTHTHTHTHTHTTHTNTHTQHTNTHTHTHTTHAHTHTHHVYHRCCVLSTVYLVCVSWCEVVSPFPCVHVL